MSITFTSLAEMQLLSCEKYGDRPLFGTKVDGAYQWMTYAEFGEAVDAFAGGLAKLGVGKGTRVAVISNNRVEWAVGAYASYALGAVYVPMYEAQLEKDWTYIINDAGASVLLVSTEAIYERVKGFVDAIDGLDHILCFEADSGADHSYAKHLAVGREAGVERIRPTGDDIAGLIYTSGTTGKPKGVVLSHGNFTSNVNGVQALLPISDGDVSCSFLPWAHSFGQTCELHIMISMGAAVGLAENVATLLDDFLLVKPTVLFAVPRIFNKIYDGLQKKIAAESPIKQFVFNKGLEVAARRRELRANGQQSWLNDKLFDFFDQKVFAVVKERFGGRLRYAVSGGAALSKEVGTFVDNIGIVVCEGYGLTETTPIVSVNTPDERQLGTIGKPIPDVAVYICDEEQNKLPVGEEGEIVVVGPNVMQGYYNLPDVTDEVIIDLDGERAFRTGDMGMIQPDGFIRITGRFKEQYKLENGKYVVPTPLEELLKLSGFVTQAFIYGMNKPHNVCLVVPDYDHLAAWAADNGIADTTPEALAKHPKCHAKIGDELAKYGADLKGYERPKKWTLLTEDFTTENDLLTPKMSVKRRNVVKKYQATIDELFA